MKYAIRTITPVHIGTGEQADYAEQVRIGGYVYPVTNQQITEFLWEDSARMAAFSEWMEKRDQELMAMISEARSRGYKSPDNRKMAALRQRFHLTTFAEKYDCLEEFEAFIERHPRARPIWIAGDQEKVRRLALHYLHGGSEVFIPGSTLKGAIRTALLFHFLEKHGKWIFKEFKRKALSKIQQVKGRKGDDGKRRQYARQMDDWLEHECFFCWSSRKKRRAEQRDEDYYRNDALFDLMKFISVTDAFTKPQRDPTNAYESSRVALSFDENDNLETTVQDSTAHLEAIPPDEIYRCHIRFDALQFKEVVRMLESRPDLGTEAWQGIQKKIKWVFGLEWKQVLQAKPVELEQSVLAHVQQCMKTFLEKVWAREQQWAKDAKNFAYDMDVKAQVNQLTDFPPQAIADSNWPLRIGFGKGFHAATELLYFLNEPEMKLLYKQIIEEFCRHMMAEGDERVDEMDRFPYSRVLVSHFDDLLPLGWAVLEPVND